MTRGPMTARCDYPEFQLAIFSTTRPAAPLRTRSSAVLISSSGNSWVIMPSNDSRPALIEPDQPRNVDLRDGVATVRTGQHFVEVDRQRVDRHLLARHSHQHAGAVRMRQIIGKLNHLFCASRLDHLVGPLVADNLTNRRIHVGDRGRVEAVGGTARRAPCRACCRADRRRRSDRRRRGARTVRR